MILFCTLKKPSLKEYATKYYNNHPNLKVEANLKSKQRYAEKKNTILEKAKEDYQCNCGATVRIYKKQRHFKSERHINLMKTRKDKKIEAQFKEISELHKKSKEIDITLKPIPECI